MNAAETELHDRSATKTILTLVLFAAGVSWMTGEDGFSLGFFPAVAALVAIGYVSGRWLSVLFATVLIPAALVADWLAFGVNITRQDEYEPLPSTPFVVIGMPIPMLLVAIGVGARRLRDRHRPAPQ